MDRETLLKRLPWISTPLILLATVIVWKISTEAFAISPFVLPPPEDVAATLVTFLGQPDLWVSHARTTLVETLVGSVGRLRRGMTAVVITASQQTDWVRPLASLRPAS